MAKFRITYIDDTDEVIEAEDVSRNNGDYRFWDNSGETTVALIPAARVKSVLKTED